MNDDRLIERVLRGDPRAERDLYDAHVERVYRLAYRILGDADDARDATQQTFIRAFARLDTFRGEASLATWLRAITVSVALNARERLRRSEERTASLEHADTAPAGAALPDPELAQRLHAAVERLPERMRIVFIMHEIEGYTHREIAVILGLAEGTCKAHLAHAREKLRSALLDYAEDWR